MVTYEILNIPSFSMYRYCALGFDGILDFCGSIYCFPNDGSDVSHAFDLVFCVSHYSEGRH